MEDELVPVAAALPNTPSVRYTAAEIMEKRGFNPIDKLITLAEDLEERDNVLEQPIHANERMKIYTTLAKFHSPQPKTVDINVVNNHVPTIQVVNFEEFYEKRKEFIPNTSGYFGPALSGAIEKVEEEFEDDLPDEVEDEDSG